MSHPSPPNDPTVAPDRSVPVPASRRINPSVIVSAALFLILTGVSGYFILGEAFRKTPGKTVPRTSRDTSLNPLAAEREAYHVLERFLSAASVDDKIPLVLNGPSLKPALASFYRRGIAHEDDIPASAFAVHELDKADHQRGLFLLTFEQPPAPDLRWFFPPIVPMESQYGLSSFDLLTTSFADSSQFDTKPVTVQAFFRKTGSGMKLDWEIYAQTRYRTFETFIRNPRPNQKGIFRVILEPGIADPLAPPSERDPNVYRVSDISGDGSHVLVTADPGSPAGRELSRLNWVGEQRDRIQRIATVELAWTGEPSPAIGISRFICWEFLNLGTSASPTPAQ